MRTVYYEHSEPPREQAGFRTGRAGRVLLDCEGTAVTDWRVVVPPNSLHALIGHGVVEALNALPFVIGPITAGRDAVLRPTALSDASRVLYEADRRTYGGTWEFVTAEEGGCDPAQFRIVIDNREYQRTLARLQYLVTMASREGHSVILRL